MGNVGNQGTFASAVGFSTLSAFLSLSPPASGRTMLTLNQQIRTVGLGLLYYGQNYLIYPSAFPPGSRTGATTNPFHLRNASDLLSIDVPVPTQYGLPYEDVALDTEDHIKVHAFSLIQRVDLPDEASVAPSTVGMSDEEVR